MEKWVRRVLLLMIRSIHWTNGWHICHLGWWANTENEKKKTIYQRREHKYDSKSINTPWYAHFSFEFESIRLRNICEMQLATMFKSFFDSNANAKKLDCLNDLCTLYASHIELSIKYRHVRLSKHRLSIHEFGKAALKSWIFAKCR